MSDNITNKLMRGVHKRNEIPNNKSSRSKSRVKTTLKRIHITVFALIFSALSIAPSNVSALSDFDTTYQSTSTVSIGASNWYGLNCSTTDITDSWANAILNSGNQTMIDSFNNRVSWAVTEEFADYGSMSWTGVRVFWSESLATGIFSGYQSGGIWYRMLDFNAPTVHSAYVVNKGVSTGNYYDECDPAIKGYFAESGYPYPGTGYGTSAVSPYLPVYNDPLSYDGYHFYLSYEGSNFSKILYVANTTIDYPSGYAGADIEDGSIDDDNDGLSLAQENSQGTSDEDSDGDTDGDGLNDLTESIWFEDRDDVFCNTSTSPYVCAYPDPTTKDLYVEIDWIYDGTESYDPTNTQLELVEEKYEELGIKFHADAGAYGGGNPIYIPEYEVTIDLIGDVTDGIDEEYDNFYALKWGYEVETYPNFNEDRYNIWRYMISGFNWYDDGLNTTSAVAEASGDDIFLSWGRMQDNPGCASGQYCYSDFDDAVAGTIVHELGHTMCLSKTARYTGQPSSCIFAGIDTTADVSYESSMNYEYQMDNTYSYSDGSNGIDDNDDLMAIFQGMDDFVWSSGNIELGGPF